MQNWEVKAEGPGPVQGLPQSFNRRQGYLVHEKAIINKNRSDPSEVLGRHETNPDAHFTISPEFKAYLGGTALDEFSTSVDSARISDGFGEQLQFDTDFVE